MRDEAVDLQLFPPHLHQRNSAKQAIQTFKNHFIAGLISTYKKYPMYLWDQLILQSTSTLKILYQ